MDIGGRADVHQINIQPENLVIIQIHARFGKPVLLLDTLRLSGDNIHEGCDSAAVREIQPGPDVGVGNAARADDRDFNHSSPPLFSFSFPLRSVYQRVCFFST